jgi:hypothetical protein
VLKVVAALVPSAGLLFLFWLALRALIQADRRERVAEANWNREHGRTEAGAPGAAPAGSGEVGKGGGDAGGTASAS